MKLGLISDIHADVDALRLALALFDDHGVDQILCAGDLAEEGPHERDVIALMRQRGIPSVQGNHDTAAISNQAWLRKSLGDDNPRPLTHSLQKRILDEPDLEFLKALPLVHRLELDGVRTLLAHGTPESNWQYLFNASHPALFWRVARDAQSDIVILGHTHVPMRVQVGGTLIINPGSVCGTYKGGSRTCAILNLPSLDYTVFEITSRQPVNVPINEIA